MANCEIEIYRYQDSNSDKVWAVDKTLNPSGRITVWYGRWGNKLTENVVEGTPSLSSRIKEKTEKGYQRVTGYSLDDAECKLVPESTPQPNTIPTSVWFRISQSVPSSVINDCLTQMLIDLTEHSAEEGDRLSRLPLYVSLLEGDLQGGFELREGPLGLLLLYALRRYLDKSNIVQIAMHIADDRDNLVPEEFNDLNDLMTEAFELFLVDKKLIKDGDGLLDSSKLSEIGEKIGLKHYSSTTLAKPLAIAMGCIDAPLNLSAINTTTNNAFF